MEGWFQAERVVEWLKEAGGWALLCSLLLGIIIGILGIVPSVFLSGANAVVFGLMPGFFISLTGEVLGAAASFWLYRLGIRKLIAQKGKHWGWVNQLNAASRKRKFVILIAARLTPFIPSGFITFAAASTNILFLDFILASLIGKVPSVAMETLIGHDLFYLEDNFLRLIISIVLIGFVYSLFRSQKKTSGS